MRNPLLIALASTALAGAGWATGAIGAPSQPPGSYQASCRNIMVASDGQLVAECKDMSGAFRWSRIPYQHCHGDVANANGVMTCNGATATVAPPPATGRPSQPTGSYAASCRSIQVVNGVMTADCKDMRGNFRTSSIPYQRCHGELGNNNGVLTCNGATATIVPAPGRGDAGGWNGNQGGRPDYGDRGPGGPDYGDRGPGGPDYGQPPPGRPNTGAGDAGVYPEFAPLEDHIRDAIRDSVRSGRIDHDQAHDLFGQLRTIQDRERWEFQNHGWNLPQDDRWRIRHDLKQLDAQVDQGRWQP